MLFGIIMCAALILVVALTAALLQTFSESQISVDDELRREKILDCLPGENCCACGYSDCASLALAIALKKAPFNACPAGGVGTAEAIGVIMGTDSEDRTRYRAQVMCSGDDSVARSKYIYESGASDCLAAMKLGGGEKGCKFACVGFGNCAASCPFGAISISNGIAKVDHLLCKGCGTCISACPKHLIKLVPYDTYYWVGCMSKETQNRTVNNCSIGCTGCGQCVSVCPENAVELKNHCAEIDYAKCSGCGMCFASCPQGIVWKADAYGNVGLSFSRKGSVPKN